MWNHCLVFGIHSERSVSWLEANDLLDDDGGSLKQAVSTLFVSMPVSPRAAAYGTDPLSSALLYYW